MTPLMITIALATSILISGTLLIGIEEFQNAVGIVKDRVLEIERVLQE